MKVQLFLVAVLEAYKAQKSCIKINSFIIKLTRVR